MMYKLIVVAAVALPGLSCWWPLARAPAVLRPRAAAAPRLPRRPLKAGYGPLPPAAPRLV
jgi:hypothetical protein